MTVMTTHSFKIHVEQETIAGFIINNNNSYLADFVYLHGGGDSSYKERVYDIADPIIKNDNSILSIDFSGHGESSGELKKGSLKKRVTEAQAAIQTFTTAAPLTICGASMGGYIAIKMLKLFHVNTLILMCPALYNGAAYDVPFDQEFTEILRMPESWRQTDALEIIKNFTGKLLIIIGDKLSISFDNVLLKYLSYLYPVIYYPLFFQFSFHS